jgi:hypothetical protein
VTAFAKSNSVQVAFIQTMLSTNLTGGTCTIYVLAEDADIMRDFMELRSQVLTNRSTE